MKWAYCLPKHIWTITCQAFCYKTVNIFEKSTSAVLLLKTKRVCFSKGSMKSTDLQFSYGNITMASIIAWTVVILLRNLSDVCTICTWKVRTCDLVSFHNIKFKACRSKTGTSTFFCVCVLKFIVYVFVVKISKCYYLLLYCPALAVTKKMVPYLVCLIAL